MLGAETPERETIEFRSKVLQDVVTHTDVVEKQSELLHWSTLTPEELNPIIDELIKEAKEKEKQEKKAEKKKKNSTEGNALAKASAAAEAAVAQPGDEKKWYFYNRAMVAQGINRP